MAYLLSAFLVMVSILAAFAACYAAFGSALLRSTMYSDPGGSRAMAVLAMVAALVAVGGFMTAGKLLP